MERVLAASPFLCGIQDAEGRWRYFNDALRRWFGPPHPEADEYRPGDTPHPGLVSLIHHVSVDGPPAQTIVSNGNGGRALLTASRIPWQDRAAILFCGYEISESIRLDKDRLAALAESSRVLDAFVHPVVTVDPEIRIRAVNHAAGTVMNSRQRDVLGCPLETVLKVTSVADGDGDLAAIVARTIHRDQGKKAVFEAALVRRDGADVPVKITVSPFPGEQDPGGAVIIFEDLSDLHQRQSQLSIKARHDPLTGLINREEFTDRLNRLLERTAEQQWSHSLCFMDLDQFKAVNDTAGHAAGDELLRQITNALLNRVRGRDTLARIGGDEFAILLEHCALDEAREVAEKLRQTVADFVFEWEGRRFSVGASIGLVPIAGEQPDTGRVIAMADTACYQAKHGGRNRVCVLESEDDQCGRRMIETLRRALVEDTLLLYAQPIVSLTDDEPAVMAREILLRLPTGPGIASPHEFVPATRHRLNVEMDRWVLDRTSSTSAGDSRPLFVNVGVASIQDRGFVDHLETGGTCDRRLCIDVAEAALIEAGEAVARFCDAVRRRGCDIALAFRCEGPSAVYMLETVRPAFLTVDLRPLTSGDRSFRRRVARHLLELGRQVGATTIATHVENAELLAIARDLGFDWAQGYLLGGPERLEAGGEDGG